tara:strand:- start:315 stop:926 length:612 start_codon:yes stop_codon:yes gene_type:complete
MAIQVSGTTVISDGRLIQNLGGLVIPSGNTASRPGSPSSGQMYHNTETDEFEVYGTITIPAGWVTQYQGVVGGNNTIFSNYRINTLGYPAPAGTPTPLVFDTDFGIQFKTNEKAISTDGKDHRLTKRYNFGYLPPPDDFYSYVEYSTTFTMSGGGGDTNFGGGVAFTWMGLGGGNPTGGDAMKLEVYNSGVTYETGWQKVGAY